MYKDETVIFDNSLSVSSDDNIKYVCWIIDGVNVECDGNSSQCSSSCNGASFDSINWDNGFTHSFTVVGNYNVTIVVGSETLYSDSYSESYCVSGGGVYCWSCIDGLLNDDETDIDWGGHCGTPYFLKCNNGLLDNVTNESSVDYGGACGNCDNSSIVEDFDLVFLKDSGLIIYPFDGEQCSESVAVSSGIVTFVFVLGGLLLVPLLLLFVLLIVLLLMVLFSSFGVLGFVSDRFRVLRVFLNDKKENNK